MELKTSKTLHNLAAAFAGECQAGARYQFLAKKAEQAKLTFVSDTLKELATNEMAHAKVFYDYITANCKDCIPNVDINAGYPFKSGDVIEMLNSSAKNESMESTTIYPQFAKVAKDEGFLDIAASFTLISEVENCHSMLLTQLHEKLKANNAYVSTTPIKWKCTNCGHEGTAKTAWTICPLCHYVQGYVKIPLQS